MNEDFICSICHKVGDFDYDAHLINGKWNHVYYVDKLMNCHICHQPILGPEPYTYYYDNEIVIHVVCEIARKCYQCGKENLTSWCIKNHRNYCEECTVFGKKFWIIKKNFGDLVLGYYDNECLMRTYTDLLDRQGVAYKIEQLEMNSSVHKLFMFRVGLNLLTGQVIYCEIQPDETGIKQDKFLLVPWVKEGNIEQLVYHKYVAANSVSEITDRAEQDYAWFMSELLIKKLKVIPDPYGVRIVDANHVPK